MHSAGQSRPTTKRKTWIPKICLCYTSHNFNKSDLCPDPDQIATSPHVISQPCSLAGFIEWYSLGTLLLACLLNLLRSLWSVFVQEGWEVWWLYRVLVSWCSLFNSGELRPYFYWQFYHCTTRIPQILWVYFQRLGCHSRLTWTLDQPCGPQS